MYTIMWKVFVFVLVLCVVVDARKYKKEKVAKERKSTISKRQAVGTCGPLEFRCHDGTCIQEEWTCDTDRDCADGSDELNCPTDCSGEHQVKCNNGRCVPSEFRCDHDDDCGDNTDELNCHKVTCPPGEVQCDNYFCIEEVWLCDGDNDCGDNWDERNCAGSCHAGQFRCADGSKCIPEAWKCDGDDDCADRSDETDCVCTEQEFKCTNGKCIPSEWRCDTDNDCGDASDEQHCPTIHPSVCENMLTERDCALMNETTTPICLNQELGHKFCRKYCSLGETCI